MSLKYAFKFTLIMTLAAIFWLASAWLSPALANDQVSGIPNLRYDYPSAGLHQFVLGRTCLSLPTSNLELECNPAHMAESKIRQFRINVSGYERFGKVNEYRQRLSDGDSVGIVNSLLAERDPLLAKASTDIWYQHENWAMGVTPVRVGFASWVRNPAYPQISADIYKESEIFGKYATALASDPHFRMGLTARYVDRDFFRKDVAFLDAMGNRDLLKIEKHRGLYLEPGVSYVFDMPWTSAVSATFTNLPIYQSEKSYPFKPIFDLGFSTAPTFASGRLRTSTHFSNHPDAKDVFEFFRWGVVYDLFHNTTTSFSLGKSEFAFGASGNIDSVVLGLGYKVQELALDNWESKKVASVLFEAGLVF